MDALLLLCVRGARLRPYTICRGGPVTAVVSFVETSVLCANAGQVVVPDSDIDT